MRHAIVFGAALLSLAPAVAQDAAVPSEWDIRMRRVEGASADIRRASEAVQETANNISNSNNLRDIALLNTQLAELNKMLISARLAVAISVEEAKRP